jgi:hypothetical protein
MKNAMYDQHCPCSGCIHEKACIAEKQACLDFLHFVEHSECIHEDREPSFRLYKKIFPTEVWDFE